MEKHDPTEPVSFSALEKKVEEERRIASLDLEGFFELFIGICLIGGTVLVALLPIINLARHATGGALGVMCLCLGVVIGVMARKDPDV